MLDAELLAAFEDRQVNVAVGEIDSVLSQPRPLQPKRLLIELRRRFRIRRANSDVFNPGHGSSSLTGSLSEFLGGRQLRLTLPSARLYGANLCPRSAGS